MTTEQHPTANPGTSEVLDSSAPPAGPTADPTPRRRGRRGRSGRRGRRNPRLIAGVAVVAVVAGLGAAAAARGTGSASGGTSGNLPMLALAPQANVLTGNPNGALGVDGSTATGPGAVAPGPGTIMTWAGPGLITVHGTLPTGPNSAPIVKLGTARPAGVATVRAVGAALGLSGTPVRATDAWLVRGSAGVLSMADSPGHPWVFVRGTGACSTLIMHAMGNQPDIACAVGTDPGSVSSSGTVTSSGTVRSSGSGGAPGSGGSGTPGGIPPRLPGLTVHPAPTPSVAQTLSLASPVFVAAGLNPAQAVVAAGYARIDPTIDGRPTSGAATTVEVGPTGNGVGVGVQYAAGWLLDDTRDGPAYPIIGAAAALQRLRQLPVPAIGMACIRGSDCTFRTVVTGATLGLTLAWDRGAPVLVPAWIFRTVVHLPGATAAVAGTLDAVAVNPKFLGPTSEPTPAVSGGAVPGASSSGDNSSGLATTGPPSSTPGSPNTVPKKLAPRTPVLKVAPQAR